ncbi:MAG: Holliday junction resolvase Hjc [Candidatus Woesearchaeota archaeon]
MRINTKNKGTAGERELIHLFWKEGWAAFRAAGSGSSTHPCPDLIAGNRLRRAGIECKRAKKTYKYISKKEIEDLQTFCQVFGAEPWIAVKFDGLEWFFLTIEDLKETQAGFVVTEDITRNKGLLFEEFLG